MKSIYFLSVLLLTPMAEATDDPRAGAWDRSVALEIAGDLPGAEKVMHHAWGSDPQNYWVRLRLAYLALIQQRGEEARERYQWLRTMPESTSDPDVPRGHASAIASVGWQRAVDKETAMARGLFREALAIDPANQSATLGLSQIPPLPLAIPEVWTGITTHSLGIYRYRGAAAYAHLPVRIADTYVLRGAFRYVYSQETTHGSPYRFVNPERRSWQLNEGYLALARDTRWLGLEAIVLRSQTTDHSTVFGGAGRLRIGSSYGLVLESSVLSAKDVTTNTQLRPMAFFNLENYLSLQAGIRVTRDQRGNSTSATLGASGFLRSWGLHLQGHLGSERWAFTPIGPSFMSLDVETTYGGSATLVSPITKHLHFSLQAEGERIRTESAVGSYFSISAGFQLALGEQ